MALKFTRLTREAIRALKPGERINEHGIAADKVKNGDVRFSVNIMVDGQRIQRVVGRDSEGVTRFQAEQLIEKLKTDARADRLDLPQNRKLHRTVSASADEYLQILEQTNGKNLKNKRRHFDQHLNRHFGKFRLDKVTSFDIQRYRKLRKGEGVSEATVNRELATLSHLLNCAAHKDWRWIKPDKVPHFPMSEEVRKPIRILTAEQVATLIAAAAEDQDPYSWLFVMMGLNTAMRHTEILGRRYDEIDWDKCRIWIDRAKAGERHQPITPALRDALARQREMEDEPEGWIFPTSHARSQKPHRLSMAKQFRRVVKRAGLDPKQCTPHTMRHTGISRLAMAKVDVATIQKISGHKTTKMVMHYVHLFDGHIDEAMGALDTGFVDTVTPELHTPAEAEAGEGGKVIQLSRDKTAA